MFVKVSEVAPKEEKKFFGKSRKPEVDIFWSVNGYFFMEGKAAKLARKFTENKEYEVQKLDKKSIKFPYSWLSIILGEFVDHGYDVYVQVRID